MTTDDYLAALAVIPRGETRTFHELAVLAGHPGAARAAGRVVGALGSGSALPWHRVVAADGTAPTDPRRRAEQARRLQAEGARPRAGETVRAWALRVGARVVVHLPKRRFLPASDPRVDRWRPCLVTAAPDRVSALTRGFVPWDTPDSFAVPPAPAQAPARALPPPATPLSARLLAVGQEPTLANLQARGFHRLAGLLAPRECQDLRLRFERDAEFERTIDMAPKGYGIGRYRYFKEPGPPPIRMLRAALYAQLLDTARRQVPDLPGSLAAFHARCRAAGQLRGSCIVLRYDEGGVNHPHRDLYGPVWFPFQAVVLLSRRGVDFEGGEFVVLGKERHEIPVDEGDLVVFQSQLRHAMLPVTRGVRFAAGVVMHLAR